MKNAAKRLASLALALVFLLALLPGGVLAAEIVKSGKCGDNLTWTLDSDGVLRIEGTGAITESPWGYPTDITSVIIGDGVISIGDWVFTDCSSLTSVTIPDSVVSIGDGAFNGCKSLTSVTIPDSVVSIGNSAFYFCSSLTSITIPDSVVSIGVQVFRYCSSLASVTIPDSVVSIGDGAFLECTSLTSVAIPDSVTSIGQWAFGYCYGLTNVVIGKSVDTIGGLAFYHCDNLTSITIGKSVAIIGDSAFQGCTALTDVYYGGSETEWKAIDIGRYNDPLLNAEIHYITPLTITKQPVNYTGASGSKAAFTVAAEGDGLTYQWYVKNPGASKFSRSSITKATYSVTLTANNSGRQLYCVITDKYGQTAQTNTVTMTVKAEPFGAPVLKSASAGTNGITVTWGAVSGATQYRVYRKTGSGGWTGLKDVTGTSYTDAAVTGGTTYTYTVKAYNGTTWSGFDAKGVSATAKDVFGAPVLKGAAAGTNGITVTWGAVSGATTYRVYRRTGSGGWTGLKDVTGTSYTDAAVTSGTTYTYTVKAWNGSAWSGFDSKGVTATAK